MHESLHEDTRINRALEFAKKAHEGQTRKSGEPFVEHPIRVVKTITDEWGIKDPEMIIAAYLHDTVEDNDEIHLSQIEEEFGSTVARLVDGLTKLKKSADISVEDSEFQTHAKIMESSYIDPRVAMIKLADRLDNMRTLKGLKPEKQIANAEETITVYIPLAWSLGMWQVKRELEDLAYQYKDVHKGVKYQEAKDEIDSDPRKTEDFIEHWESRIKRTLSDSQITAETSHRDNSYLTIVDKRQNAASKGLETSSHYRNIADVVSFTVTVDNITQCYQALGAIHQDPFIGRMVVPERLDEFVVRPRDNGYQAIHTVLETVQGAIEISFVTREMAEFNEWGVVSLLRRGENRIKERYQLKIVFTPKGDLVFIPKGATAIDAAYSINPLLALTSRQVKINDGDPTPISTVIPNAAKVEFIPSDTPLSIEELRERLNYCDKNAARLIEQQIIQLEFAKLMKEGEGLFNQELQKRGLFTFSDLLSFNQSLENTLPAHFGARNIQELYYKFGRDSSKIQELIKILNGYEITKEKLGVTSIRISGTDNNDVLNKAMLRIKILQGSIIIQKAKVDLDTQEYTIIFVIRGPKDETGKYQIIDQVQLQQSLTSENTSNQLFNRLEII